jgi:hypothetical protein
MMGLDEIKAANATASGVEQSEREKDLGAVTEDLAFCVSALTAIADGSPKPEAIARATLCMLALMYGAVDDKDVPAISVLAASFALEARAAAQAEQLADVEPLNKQAA